MVWQYSPTVTTLVNVGQFCGLPVQTILSLAWSYSMRSHDHHMIQTMTTWTIAVYMQGIDHMIVTWLKPHPLIDSPSSGLVRRTTAGVPESCWQWVERVSFVGDIESLATMSHHLHSWGILPLASLPNKRERIHTLLAHQLFALHALANTQNRWYPSGKHSDT